MPVTIQPVHRESIPLLVKSFFSEEFLTEHLGKAGQWFCELAERQGLRHPVESGIFEAYLQRARGSPDAPEVVAWRITFEAGSAASTLWALSSKESRSEFESAHFLSSDRAIGFAEGEVENDRALFIMFESGADEWKRPRLCTDAILLRDPYSPNEKHPLGFSSERVSRIAKGIEDSYAKSLRLGFIHCIGCSEEALRNAVTQVGVPELSFEKHSKELALCGKHLDREEIFEAWQKEGKVRGFGMEEAEACIRSAIRESAITEPRRRSFSVKPALQQLTGWTRRRSR